jgi:hypothetical protein
LDQDIYKTVSEIQSQLLDIQVSMTSIVNKLYSFNEFAEYLMFGLTLDGALIKAYIDDQGSPDPWLIANALDIPMLRVYGALDMLDDLGLLPEDMVLDENTKNATFLTMKNISIEDVRIPERELSPEEQQYINALNAVVVDKDNTIVEFKRRNGVNISNMTNEDMLELLLQAKMRAEGEWPMRNRENNGRWADRFTEIAESLNMPSPGQYSSRFGSLKEAKDRAEIYFNLIEVDNTPETESIMSDDVVLIEDVELTAEVETESDLGVAPSNIIDLNFWRKIYESEMLDDPWDDN